MQDQAVDTFLSCLSHCTCLLPCGHATVSVGLANRHYRAGQCSPEMQCLEVRCVAAHDALAHWIILSVTPRGKAHFSMHGSAGADIILLDS